MSSAASVVASMTAFLVAAGVVAAAVAIDVVVVTVNFRLGVLGKFPSFLFHFNGNGVRTSVTSAN